MFREFLAAHLGLVYELSGVILILFGVIAVSGALISRFDRIPLEDAIYFAFITAFTVGFGDVAPHSRSARVVTVFLALFGVIIVGIAVAVAVHALDIAMAARG
jgi:voltage-gated potassium channel